MPTRRGGTEIIMKNRISQKTAFCGISIAISVMLMGLTAVFTLNKVFFAALSTVVFPLISIRFGRKTAWVAVAAAVLLIFILLPDKLGSVFYGMLAIYSVVKGIVESRFALPREIALKAVCYAAAASVTVIFVHTSFFAVLYILLFGAAAFAVYDIALTYAISFLNARLPR